jgi:ABC-2 type transport system permease protein
MSANFPSPALQTLCRKEVRRFMRVVVQTVLSPLINSTLYLMIFGLSLGSHIGEYGGVTYLAFVIPGLIMLTALNNSFQNSSSSIITSKFHGDLQDLRIAPIKTSEIVLALSFGALARGLAVGTVTFLVAQVFYRISQGSWLIPAHPLLMMFFIIVGSLCFGMLGIIVGFRSKNFEGLNAISAFILVPLLYLGGTFFSVDGLHPFWRSVAHANPLLYFTSGFRYAILDKSDIPAMTSVTVAAVTLIVLYVVSSRAVHKGYFGKW